MENVGELLEQIEELIESEDHGGLTELLDSQRTSDIAEVIELLDDDPRRLIFDVMPRERSADILEKVDEATRGELFELLDEEFVNLVTYLPPDDAADVLGELSAEETDEVLKKLTPAESARIKNLMTYSEDSAGGIMDPVVLSVSQGSTVSEAIKIIRRSDVSEEFLAMFVVDDNGHFLGGIQILSLLVVDKNVNITELIDKDTIYVTAETDQEEVRNIFSKNELMVVPVLDSDHRLIGRITADRVIEVAEEEAAEDVYTMAGTDADELNSTSVFYAARIRLTWLLPCLVGTAVTAFVYLFFKNLFLQTDMFATYVAAFAFAPMIGALSGNAGLQTSAVVVCGLATGSLAALRVGQVFIREVRIAVLIAISCGILGALVCAVLPNLVGGIDDSQSFAASLKFNEYLHVVIAFAIAMFSAIMVSTTLGLFLPFLFRSVGIDPAISSGPLVTTANDSISVLIYMSLVMLLT